MRACFVSWLLTCTCPHDFSPTPDRVVQMVEELNEMDLGDDDEEEEEEHEQLAEEGMPQ